jgi:transcriptional regulator with XRE-family HTH domain
MTRQGLRRIPNFHTRRLVRELIQLRKAAHLGQKDVFESTQLDVQKMSRIETGQLPRYLELNALLDLYGVPSCDWKPYQETWMLAKEKGWWEGQSLRDVLYIGNEHEASAIRDLQLVYLPALLQTEKYARQLLQSAQPPFSKQRLPVELAARMRRQNLLDGEDAVRLHALIYQPVLHFGVNRQQLQLLLDRAAQPNVTIQIIAQAEIPHGGMDGAFTILSYRDKDEPDLIHTDGPLGPGQTDNDKRVAILRRTFASLAERAMSAENSRAYIENLLHHTRTERDD